MNFQEFKIKGYKSKEDKIRSAGLFYRVQRIISIRISFFLLKVFPGINANNISMANIILLFFILFLSIFLNQHNAFLIVIIQLLLLNFTGIIDKVDGEIARCKDYITQKGIYYDVAYHFFYPFVFYFTAAYFYFVLSNIIYILIGGIALGILAMNDKMFGKIIIHHVKAKILKQGSQDKIQDYLTERKKQKRPILPFRLINYFVFMIYDWTWCLYFLLILLAYYFFPLSCYIYVIHLIASVILVNYKVLVANPLRSLFSKEELR